MARLELGDHAGAADDFTASLRGGVRPVGSYLGRATAREAVGDAAGAAADRRAVAALNPGSAAEWGERARFLEVSDPAAARHDYEQAITAGAHFPGPYRGLLGLVLDRAADDAAALRTAEAAAARFPERAEFHAAAALALARSGRHAEARLAVADADRRNPGPLEALRVAATLARSPDRADQAEALRWLRRAYLSGFRDTARLDTTPDFAELRETGEYRALRAALEELNQK